MCVRVCVCVFCVRVLGGYASSEHARTRMSCVRSGGFRLGQPIASAGSPRRGMVGRSGSQRASLCR